MSHFKYLDADQHHARGLLEIINELYPNIDFTAEGDEWEEIIATEIMENGDGKKSTDADGNTIPALTKEEYDNAVVKWEEQRYFITRKYAYPDKGDQLDDLYKSGAFSAEMEAKIQKVKDDNPKVRVPLEE